MNSMASFGEKYLFDTNILIGLGQKDHDLISFVKSCSQESVYFSTITKCEFIAGLSSEEEINNFAFLKTGKYLEVTAVVAEVAGKIQLTQRATGRKIKTPDALIIATAIENKLTLVTRDKGMKFVEEHYRIKVLSP